MFFCPGVTAAVFLPSFPLFSTFCWPRLWAVGVSKCSRSIHVSTGHGCLLDQSIYLATQQRFLEKKKAAQHRRWTADEAGTKAATTLGDTTSNLFGLFWRLWLYLNVLNSFKSYPIPFHSFQRITTSTITSLHGRDSADVDLVQDFRPGEGSRSRQKREGRATVRNRYCEVACVRGVRVILVHCTYSLSLTIHSYLKFRKLL